MLPQNLTSAQRPELHVFYLLDTSGSMQGNPIGVLNRAMDSTVDALRQVAAHNSNARVKIAVLEFNTGFRWVTKNGPEDLEYFRWIDLTASGMTYVGAALDELGSKLRKDSFLASSTGSFLPVVIFMTDGYANDDYMAALKRLKQNKYFNKATRIGFAIGKKPDVSMIANLTGDSEAVIRTDDLGLFATMLKFVSTSSVNIASQSYTSEFAASGSNAVRTASQEANIDPRHFAPGFSYSESQDGTLLVDTSNLARRRVF